MDKNIRNYGVDWKRSFVIALVIVLLQVPRPLLKVVRVPWTELELPLWAFALLGLYMLEAAFLLIMVIRLAKHGFNLTQVKGPLPFKTEYKCENWAISLGWFIPRKYRNDIIGDILEDIAEMRETGCTERRIKFHVLYQWLLAVVTLVPASIIGILIKQVKSPPK